VKPLEQEQNFIQMKDLSVNELGMVDMTNYPLAVELLSMDNNDYDVYSFKSCGGSCGDSNCS